MAMTLSSANGSFLPDQVHDLIVRPVEQASVATQVSTVVRTSAASFRIPVVSADPTAAWIAEGAEITASDATFTETTATFKKLAGLTIVSRELADDSSPEAAKVVGDGLARDIARKLDQAYFAATTSNGPSGIKSLTTTTVDRGESWTDVDSFTEAVYAAEAQGAVIDNWVSNPADALLLAKLREQTGSLKPLLQPDVTQAGRRTIAGVGLLTSTAVTAGEIWGIPKARTFVVIRTDVTIEQDRSVFFTSDRVAIKATLRCGFAFPQPLAIVKIFDAD